jgi:phytoene dehydrogenase-like protein
MSESTASDVVVVGAGPAGLAAAVTLHRAGIEVTVLEAADAVGGRVRTDVVDGFRLDRGFQVLLTAYPDLARFLDLDALELRHFSPGALVRVGGRLHRVADPLRLPLSLVSSATAPVGGLVDKLRLAAYLGRLRRSDPHTLLRGADIATSAALRARGFGPRIVDRFFRPLLGGMLLDPDLGASRRMADVLLRCLAVGDAAVPAHGMQAIPEQIAATLPAGALRLGVVVRSVRPGVVGTDGGDLRTGRVIVATEGPTAVRLLGLPPVSSRSVTGVWFAAPVPPVRDPVIILDGDAAGPARNVAVMSNVAPEYAPAGSALVVAACPGVFDRGIAGAVRRQLRSWWPAVDTWTELRTDAARHGQPGIGPPFEPRRRVDLGDGVFVCGDHRDTPSIQGALHSGRRTADAVLESLGVTTAGSP